MTQNELAKIIECVTNSGAKGISLVSLASQSGIDLQSLNKYLTKHSDYFVQLPNSKRFKLNRFGRFKGDTSEMLKHHEQSLKTNQSSNFLLFFMLAAAVITSIMAVVSNAT